MDNWAKTQERFIKWWAKEPIGYPLMKITARDKPHDKNELTPEEDFINAADIYLNAEKKVRNYKNYLKTHWLLADSFPSLSLDIGPGSFAIYVGSEPVFTEETVWFSETMKDINDQGSLAYDAKNKWLLKHLEMYKTAKALSNGEFLLNIPDIVENIDILAALRGPQNTCYDLMDDPVGVKKALSRLNAIYFKYYDAFYDIVKLPDGSSSYTAFAIWGPGKTAKVQCDFNVMMSPAQFREFVLPGLQEQCDTLDNSIFHLDGPDAIKHAPAVMDIKKLTALQWTCGAGQPDGGSEKWYKLYDIVAEAEKNLWLAIGDGSPKDWAERAVKLVKRYGPDRLYLLFGETETKEEADAVIEAVKNASA